MRVARTVAVACLCSFMIGGCSTSRSYESSTYVVRAQDTLYSIAWRHDIDYRLLARWNNIGADYRVSVGQVLRMSPPRGEGSSAAPRAGVVTPLSSVTGKLPNADAASRATIATPTTPTTPAPPAPSTSGGAPSGGAPSVAVSSNSASGAGVAAPLAPPMVGAHLKWVWPTDRQSAPVSVPSGGILLLGKLGQDVRAAGSGRVVYTGGGIRGYGNLIIIKHVDGLLSSYAHNREILVHEGQDVVAGQTIAHMGTGAHQVSALYFEIRLNGKPTDPLRYLAPTK